MKMVSKLFFHKFYSHTIIVYNLTLLDSVIFVEGDEKFDGEDETLPSFESLVDDADGY